MVYYKLDFETLDKKKYTLKVNNGDPAKQSNISSLMDSLVTDNVIVVDGKNLTKKLSASMYNVTTTGVSPLL